MLSSTLLQTEAILKKKLNNDDIIIQILKFLENYKRGMWIYPGVFIRKFNISVKDIYDIFESMEQEGILESYYEQYCSNCQKSVGTVRVFNQLPETFYCEVCNLEMPTLENIFLIYKVEKDD